MSAILGLDIGKEQLDGILLRDGHEAEYARFDTSQAGFKKLWRWLKKYQAQPLHVCMEATGLYYEPIADFLHQQGALVSVVNPARIKAYAASQMTRNKTDKLDASLIADFCRTQHPPIWTPPSPEWRELRALARHLEDLQEDLQRQRNRLHARQQASHPVATVVDNLQTQIHLLTAQMEQVKQAMNHHIDQHPNLKRDRDLMSSISGIGDLTAAKLLAEFHDIHLFDNVRELVAFAGLNPRQHQSGSSIRGQTKISKMGASSIRAALYMPAVVAKTHNPILRAFAQRLEQRGLCHMEIVVAVMRKLLHLVYGILKSGQPFDPHHLEKTAVIA
jgi:transposase